MITKMLQRKNAILKLSSVCRHEELCSGELIPTYQPSYVYSKIKTRKYTQLVNKYASLRDLVALLEKSCSILAVKNVKVEKGGVEESLLKVTHQLVVVNDKNGNEKEFLVPRCQATSFKQLSFRYVKLEERYFYKCLSDRNNLILLKFKYSITTAFTTCHFTVFSIDKFCLHVTRHDENISLDSHDQFKFDILLNSGILIFLWPHQQKVTILNFNGDTLSFRGFTVEDNMSDEYFVEIISGYLAISTNDDEFTDNVFSIKDSSKRLTTYYNIMTGYTFNSKKALADIAELTFLEHPTDVIYLNMFHQPMWCVLEWALPETAIGKLIFCTVHDGYVSAITKEIDFTKLFIEYKTLFKTPNEKQFRFKFCYSTFQLCLWASQRHIIVINLKTFSVDCILELQTDKYSDFKGDFYEFNISISLNGQNIDVYVNKGKDVFHFEQFILPPPQTLKQSAKNIVLNTYSKSFIDKFDMQPALRKELLLAC